ncbi:MAG TPA: chloride channel protein [Pyrinomonadaceae bacterium]|nr:chloride channel protein [Pyrinomonadaceae bacterium]
MRQKAYWRIFRVRWRRFKLDFLRLFIKLLPSESQRVFFLTIVAGALCGLAAVAFHVAIIKAEELLMGAALASTHALWLGILTPVAGGLICGALLTYVVPGARGSGIPQVKVAFAIKGGRLSLREVAGKFVISVLQIGSGGSLGREGPTVHICAGIASALGRTFALSQKNLKRLVPVGAAAGIAAAFNAPIAAVTFTIEEVVGDLDQTVLSGVIVAAAIAAAIERGILGEHPVLSVAQSYGLQNAASLIFYALLGLAAAFVSLAFTESLLRVRGWFNSMATVPGWIKPAIGGGVTGALAVAALYLLNTGGVNGGGYGTLSIALAGSLTFKVMAVLCVFKLIATVFSYSSGGAGGIFAPALFIGGMLGGVVGIADIYLLGTPDTAIGAFALVGMGAVFAGIVRAPITSVLIIFEMTGSYGLILPLMIANMTAYALARFYRPVPIYEALLEQDNIHLPHRRKGAGHALEQITVAEAYQPNAVVLDAGLTVAEAVDFVRNYEFTTFPIVDNEWHCVGVITEMRLRRNLANKAGAVCIREIADESPTVHPDQPLSQAVLRMDHFHVRQLSVIERAGGHKMLGIITMSDIVRAQAGALAEAHLSFAPTQSEAL